MNRHNIRDQLRSVLTDLPDGHFPTGTRSLLAVLGYESGPYSRGADQQRRSIHHVASRHPFIRLLDKIRDFREIDPFVDTREQEAEIDQLVYRLYGLTAEEIAAVRFNMSSTRSIDYEINGSN